MGVSLLRDRGLLVTVYWFVEKSNRDIWWSEHEARWGVIGCHNMENRHMGVRFASSLVDHWCM